MKRLIAPLFASILLVACGENIEEKANARLQTARQAFEQGDFDKAKAEIDSIKILYPKAFNSRKESAKLRRQVEMKEQQIAVTRLDSIIKEKEAAFEAIKDKFTLEKNKEYQDIGNYFWPSQTVEKNLHRSFLRFQVSEKGIMTMTSIYCGPNSIHHTAIKVTAPDGTFTQTPASKDSYETTDMGEKIEKADYRLGEDGNVMGFIYLNNAKNIRVEYQGDKKYSTLMSPADRQALKKTYELSQILSSLEQAKKEKEDTLLKIEFINRNIERNE